MLVSKIYQYFKGKPEAPASVAADGEQKGEVAPADPVVQPQGSNQSLRWRVTLLIALAIPVFLETLDYTGLENYSVLSI